VIRPTAAGCCRWRAYGPRFALRALLVAPAILLCAACADAPSPSVGESVPEAPQEVDLAAISGPLTYSEHIAPILLENCSACHREGRPAPFSVTEYEQVRRRGPQIAVAVETRYMPPWLPEPGYGHFAADRRLSDGKIAAIRRWVDEGMQEGDPALMPTIAEDESGWQLGEPDLVVRMPDPYTLPGGEGDVFRNFVIPAPLDERRFVRQVQFRPGNGKIVHHALITIDDSRSSRRLDEMDPDPGYYTRMALFSEAQSPNGHFIGWTPGKVILEGREDIAWELRAGTDLVLQLHMLPQAGPEVIQSELGLYFADSAPTRDSFVVRLGPKDIDIPAGEPEYWIREDYVLPVDVEAFAIYPHAHYIAKEMKGYATLPDGTVEWLIWIKQWDFMRQDWYMYEEPVSLPAGTTLTMEFAYDNSADNPANPSNPPVRVEYGPRSSDEMGDLWIQVILGSHKDLATLESDFALKEVLADIAGIRRTVAANPDSAGDYHNLGLLLKGMGEYEEAGEAYRTALSLAPDSAEANYNYGMLLQVLDRQEEALRHFDHARRFEPDWAAPPQAMGLLLMSVGAHARAEDLFREALQLDPAMWEAYDGLGSARAALGFTEDAVTNYRRAVALQPRAAELRNNLGGALAQTGQLDEAADEFRVVLMLDPESERGHINLALTLELQEDYEQALVHYREALRIRPDYEQALAGLDRVLAIRRHP